MVESKEKLCAVDAIGSKTLSKITEQKPAFLFACGMPPIL
jgi:hypothetical protein